jgi:hypothetical protein
MERDREFAIDGTGRVIRAGDEVIVRALTLSQSAGPAVVKQILPESCVAVEYRSTGALAVVRAVTVMRADDGERVNGLPLWSYL